MPYPKKLLNNNETIALDMHPHWWHFAKAGLALVVAIIFGIFISFGGPDGGVGDLLGWVAILAILASAIWLISRYVQWSTTNFVITSDRVIYRSGVIGKSGIEIPLERVNTVLSNQSAFERVLGCGDLLIESAGEMGQQRFTDITNPSRVQNLIHAQREDKMFDGPKGSSTDVATQLEKLEGLRERGSITEEEFEAEKRKLLG